jgi:hypothetical protein
VWKADAAEVFGNPVTVADLATAGVTLMGAGLALVEAFTKLILRNKPQSATCPSPLLGFVQAPPGWAEPPPPERAAFHKALFGWHCDWARAETIRRRAAHHRKGAGTRWRGRLLTFSRCRWP